MTNDPPGSPVAHGGNPQTLVPRSKRSHAAGFTLRYRPWRLPLGEDRTGSPMTNDQ